VYCTSVREEGEHARPNHGRDRVDVYIRVEDGLELLGEERGGGMEYGGHGGEGGGEDLAGEEGGTGQAKDLGDADHAAKLLGVEEAFVGEGRHCGGCEW